VRVPIGFVLRAHGLKGLLRVRAGASFSSLSHIYIADHKMKVLRAQREKDEFLVELEGVSDRDAAEMLKGAEIAVDREQLPPPDEDEVYVSDLVGCRVFDRQGNDLGEVVAVDSNGAQELLTIHGAQKWQLPFVDQLLVSVDVAARKIVCDPPEGLLDL
jgi:16S rRNA processing protein RimM